MSKHKITRRIPRKPGAQVTYTAEQTARYRSLEPRIEKARALVDQIQEIPSDQIGRELYFFPSERAPDPPGGWLVTVMEDQPDPPPFIPIPGEVPGGGAVVVQPPPNVYVAHFGVTAFDPGLPPEITDALPVEAYFPTSFIPALSLPWIEDEVTPGLTIVNTIENQALADVIVPPEGAGQSLLELGANEIGFWISFGKIYQFSPAGSAIAIFLKWVGLGFPASYTYEPSWLSYQMPSNGNTPLTSPFPPINVTAYPLGVDPNNPDPPPPQRPPIDPAAPDMPADPDPPIDPGRGHYECNCPDYSRIELQDPASLFPSRWRDRTWIDTDAGAPVGADDRVYCKHVLAAMIKRGDPLP